MKPVGVEIWYIKFFDQFFACFFFVWSAICLVILKWNLKAFIWAPSWPFCTLFRLSSNLLVLLACNCNNQGFTVLTCVRLFVKDIVMDLVPRVVIDCAILIYTTITILHLPSLPQWLPSLYSSLIFQIAVLCFLTFPTKYLEYFSLVQYGVPTKTRWMCWAICAC